MRVGLGGGVGDVVGADDEGHVGGGELGVDVLQLEHLIVRHIGLGQQDVHVARHPARDGVDGVLHLDALFLQLVGHFAQRVLGLGHGHAVAGDDDDLGGVLHDEGGVLGRALLDGAGLDPARAAGCCGITAAEAAQDDADEAAVHALAHDVAEDGARRADQGAGDDQGDVLQREAQGRRSPAGIGVQHRHHDGHVCAADGDDQGRAENERNGEDAPEGPDGRAAGADQHPDQEDQTQGQADVDQVPRRQQDRRSAHPAVQLGEGDDRAGEGDGPDGHAQRQLDDRQGLDAALCGHDAEGVGRIDGADRHQTGGQTDQGVEGRDQLRHGRHRHPLGDQRPRAPADHDAAADQDQRRHIQRARGSQRQQGHADGQTHADHAQAIAPAAGLGTGQAPEREDEQDPRGQIGQRG
ncbi:hypothetical protein D3C72_1162530 [compost metagenome]